MHNPSKVCAVRGRGCAGAVYGNHTYQTSAAFGFVRIFCFVVVVVVVVVVESIILLIIIIDDPVESGPAHFCSTVQLELLFFLESLCLHHKVMARRI